MTQPTPSRLAVSLAAASLALAATLGPAAEVPARVPPEREWRVHGGDPGHTQHSPLAQITPANVARLRVAWTYHTGDARPDNRSQIQCNPVVVDGVLYATSAGLKAFALDAGTGRELWRFDPFAAGAEENALGVNRGVVVWGDGAERRVLYSAGPYLFALDARTGKLVPGFGQGGRVDLRAGLGRDTTGLSVLSTTPGAIYRDLLILGTRVHEGPGPSAPGHVRAYDARTGAIRWTFHTDPEAGRAGLRDVASRRVEDGGRRERLERDQRRPRARARLPPDRLAGVGLLGRRPARGRSLRQLRARAEGGHRGARLALPGRAPRPVGPRPAASARARDRAARRSRDRRGRAGHEVGARVRLRPRDRRAALPDRGAESARVRPEGRACVADPAGADEAAAVRAAGLHRGGRDRPLPGLARRGPRAAAPGAQRRPVRAAEHAGHGDLPGLRRWRGVGRLGLRPRDPPPVRQRERDAVDPRDARAAPARRGRAARRPRLRAALHGVPRHRRQGRPAATVPVARRPRGPEEEAGRRHAPREGKGRHARVRVPVARRAARPSPRTSWARRSPTTRRARRRSRGARTRTSATTGSSTPRATRR